MVLLMNFHRSTQKLHKKQQNGNKQIFGFVHSFGENKRRGKQTKEEFTVVS